MPSNIFFGVFSGKGLFTLSSMHPAEQDTYCWKKVFKRVFKNALFEKYNINNVQLNNSKGLWR